MVRGRFVIVLTDNGYRMRSILNVTFGTFGVSAASTPAFPVGDGGAHNLKYQIVLDCGSSVRDSWRCALISGRIVKSRVRLCATHGIVPSSVGKLWNHEFVCARLMEMCPHQWANCEIARSSVRDTWRCALISGQILKSRVRLCATHEDVPSSVGRL